MATGSSYNSPVKENFDLLYDYKHRESSLKTTKETLANSSSILVVGGGFIGVEVIAEIAENFQGKNKKLGLMTRGNKLLSTLPDAAS